MIQRAMSKETPSERPALSAELKSVMSEEMARMAVGVSNESASALWAFSLAASKALVTFSSSVAVELMLAHSAMCAETEATVRVWFMRVPWRVTPGEVAPSM